MPSGMDCRQYEKENWRPEGRMPYFMMNVITSANTA